MNFPGHRRGIAPLAAVVVASLGIAGPTAGQAAAHDPLRLAIVNGYAAQCQRLYADCEARARALQRAVGELLATPTAGTLAAAREAWIAGRRVYGRTEVCRFYDGPIDGRKHGVETWVNAWPVDEAYIDAVQGRPDSGIVNDRANYPNLGTMVLMLANERGGETNVSVGWHAIEFLLWGQDLDPDGPGARPASDFVVGQATNADRRGQYLKACVALLIEHLAQVRAAWDPDADNYRRAFVADPDAALRKMLTGALILTAFELSGERLAVAYETGDQEQEHSCFSDTTDIDFVANQAGIEAVFTGPGAEVAPGLLALLERDHPSLAADLAQKLAAAQAALAAIPRPFDRAMSGADDGPGRTAMRAAMEALDLQAEAIAIVGRALGFDLPLKPG